MEKKSIQIVGESHTVFAMTCKINIGSLFCCHITWIRHFLSQPIQNLIRLDNTQQLNDYIKFCGAVQIICCFACFFQNNQVVPGKPRRPAKHNQTVFITAFNHYVVNWRFSPSNIPDYLLSHPQHQSQMIKMGWTQYPSEIADEQIPPIYCWHNIILYSYRLFTILLLHFMPGASNL